MKMRSVSSFVALAAVAGIALYSWRFAPVAVTTVGADRGPVDREVSGTGSLVARTRIAVSAKTQGRIVDLPVDQNDEVAEGQILARLDDSELLEQVAIAEAALEAARAAKARAAAEEVRAGAVLARARLDHGRAEALEPRSIARRELDKSLESAQVAEAEKARAEALVVEAARQVEVCERTLRYQRARLADTEIRSPFAGLVVRRDRAAGDVVVPGAQIFELISTREIWVSAWVEESSMRLVTPGQPARLAFRSDGARTYAGTVARRSREVDRETREFLVDIRLDALPDDWAVGQRVDVRIAVERRPDALRVPAAAIRWRDGSPGVYALVRDRLEWRPLAFPWTGPAAEGATDPSGGGEFAVVDAGIAAGERIVVSAADRGALAPGRRAVEAR